MRDNLDLLVQRLGRLLTHIESDSFGTDVTREVTINDETNEFGGDVTRNVNVDESRSSPLPSGGSTQGARIFDPSRLIINDTTSLEDANADGSITIEPGKTEKVVSYEPPQRGEFALLAVGLTDRRDVTYRLKYDGNTTIGGWTQSPLGTVNDLFSFYRVYGAMLPVKNQVTYEAKLSENASGSVDLAGEIHVQI